MQGRAVGYDLQEKNAWKLSRVHDILCCRLLFYFVTSTKDTASHTVFKKVSFGQPARQESDKKKKKCHNTLENHSIPRESCFQGVFFQQHNGIAKVQPCKPMQRSLGAKPRLFVGTHWHRRLWISGIFGFWFLSFLDSTDNQAEI